MGSKGQYLTSAQIIILNFLDGASKKIGARETKETRKEKVHPKPKLY